MLLENEEKKVIKIDGTEKDMNKPINEYLTRYIENFTTNTLVLDPVSFAYSPTHLYANASGPMY